MRRWIVALLTVVVLLILAVIGDRVANAVAENDIASQIQSSGFPAKPSVTITGFPFLTQLAAHDIHQIDISASNVAAGPVELSSVTATATGVHLNSSFNGGKVDTINGNVLVTFASLASAASSNSGANVSLSADGPDKVKVSVGAGPLSDSEVAQVTRTGPSQITVRLLSNGGPLGGVLSSFGPFSFDVPKLPAGLQITGVTVTAQGLRISAAGHNTQLSQ